MLYGSRFASRNRFCLQIWRGTFFILLVSADLWPLYNLKDFRIGAHLQGFNATLVVNHRSISMLGGTFCTDEREKPEKSLILTGARWVATVFVASRRPVFQPCRQPKRLLAGSPRGVPEIRNASHSNGFSCCRCHLFPSGASHFAPRKE